MAGIGPYLQKNIANFCYFFNDVLKTVNWSLIKSMQKLPKLGGVPKDSLHISTLVSDSLSARTGNGQLVDDAQLGYR